MPRNGTAFDYTSEPSSSGHTLIVSYFPNDERWIGLGTNPLAKIELEVGAYTWLNATALSTPAYPTSSTLEPISLIAAKLSSGLALYLVMNYLI
jgi:hypothetical protein